MSLDLTMDGLCCGADEALEMFESLVPDALSTGGEVNAEDYERAVNRFRWLAQRVTPIKPTFHKGHCGKKYDSYTCGKCGFVVDAGYSYCPGCGRAIDWRLKQ